jgi:hypothetical protein
MLERRRKSELGQFGETVVFERLREDGYECTPLGYFRCFDIEASKNHQNYLISVKTRNHTTHKNDEKTDPYNLLCKKRGHDVDAEVKEAYKIAYQCDAIPMWAAVRVDVVRQLYTIYIGLIDDLKNKKLIPMSPSDRRRHKTLAENVVDQRIKESWSNVRRRPVVRDGRSAPLQI